MVGEPPGTRVLLPLLGLGLSRDAAAGGFRKASATFRLVESENCCRWKRENLISGRCGASGTAPSAAAAAASSRRGGEARVAAAAAARWLGAGATRRATALDGLAAAAGDDGNRGVQELAGGLAVAAGRDRCRG